MLGIGLVRRRIGHVSCPFLNVVVIGCVGHVSCSLLTAEFSVVGFRSKLHLEVEASFPRSHVIA